MVPGFQRFRRSSSSGNTWFQDFGDLGVQEIGGFRIWVDLGVQGIDGSMILEILDVRK